MWVGGDQRPMLQLAGVVTRCQLRLLRLTLGANRCRTRHNRRHKAVQYPSIAGPSFRFPNNRRKRRDAASSPTVQSHVKYRSVLCFWASLGAYHAPIRSRTYSTFRRVSNSKARDCLCIHVYKVL
ncbi:hypothetical protein BJY00DRAFT_292011 [Aspergillus carlsbadensis]|nr:hypothetical protein BJY00DRAFT_292011 [Aspergillus carlsbadensis]